MEQVHGAHHGPALGQFDDDGALRGAQPQVPADGIQRQAAMHNIAVREDQARHEETIEDRPIDRIDLDDLVRWLVRPGVARGKNVPGHRIINPGGQLKVPRQNQRGQDRTRGRIDRQDPVRIRRALDQQQAARRHCGAPERHAGLQELQPAEEVGDPERRRQTERPQALPRREINPMHLRRRVVGDEPGLIRRPVDREIAQEAPIGVHHIVRQRGTRAPHCRHRKRSQSIGRQREIDARPTGEHIREGPGIGINDVAARPLIAAVIAFEEPAALDLRAARPVHIHRGHHRHDLQLRREGRTHHPEIERPVDRRRQQHLRFGPRRIHEERIQPADRQRAVVVEHLIHQVRRQREAGPAKRHHLPRIRRRLRPIRRRPAHRRAHQLRISHAEGRTRAPRRRHRHRPEQVGAVRRRQIRPRVTGKGVGPAGRAEVNDRHRAELILGAIPLDESAAAQGEIGRRAVDERQIRPAYHRHDLQRDRAIGQIKVKIVLQQDLTGSDIG